MFEILGMAGLESVNSRRFPLLGPWEQCSPLCAPVSHPYPRVGCGSESSPQTVTVHHPCGFPLAFSAEIARSEAAFHFCAIEGVRSGNDAGILI